MSERTYAVEIIFTVDERSDEHLQDERAIRDEVRSWLEDLGVVVAEITIKEVRS